MSALFRMLNVRRTIGQTESERGRSAEHKALEALLAFFTHESWICQPRQATKHEDLRGIDIVVPTTDIGDLFLQIKSSFHGVEKFNRRQHRQMIAVVVVKPFESQEIIWKNLREALWKLRTQILEKRRRPDWEN